MSLICVQLSTCKHAMIICCSLRHRRRKTIPMRNIQISFLPGPLLSMNSCCYTKMIRNTVRSFLCSTAHRQGKYFAIICVFVLLIVRLHNLQDFILLADIFFSTTSETDYMEQGDLCRIMIEMAFNAWLGNLLLKNISLFSQIFGNGRRSHDFIDVSDLTMP